MPWSPVGYLTASIGYFPFWFRSNAIDPSSYCVKSTLLATMSAPMASAGVWRADLVRTPGSGSNRDTGLGFLLLLIVDRCS
ncbi:hypothetical protein SLE2022_352500 [Rubroshorea leprosula]